MSATSLLVRGDEFGLCHAANQAIWEGFESGVLTCASLLAAGPWVAEAAALARAHPEWEIGVQLALECETAGCRWGPVAGPAAVPGLVQPTGTFPPQLSPAAPADEIARELTAQVERARAWGVTPAYLAYEGPAHPAVDAALAALAERGGIPARTADWGIQSILRRKPGRPFDLLAALGGLTPGFHLWVVRPARETPETWALWPDETTAHLHHADALAVCDQQVIHCLRERGIERVGFRRPG